MLTHGEIGKKVKCILVTSIVFFLPCLMYPLPSALNWVETSLLPVSKLMILGQAFGLAVKMLVKMLVSGTGCWLES